MNRGEIEPFYFGGGGQSLFGCYHAPHAASRRKCGVVLCHSLGDEYLRFHRAYRQLALRLSQLGFPVLRFDLSGCGDSSGDGEAMGVQQWLTDISWAVGEIRRRSGVGRTGLVGLRLGGALAVRVGQERGDIDALVLWDPVVSGKAYLAELRALHQDMLGRAHVRQEPEATEERTELLGFPLPGGLLRELEHLELLPLQRKPAERLLLVESQGRAKEGGLREHLRQWDVEVAYRHLPCPEFWTWQEALSEALVPHQVLQSVVRWLAEVYP